MKGHRVSFTKVEIIEFEAEQAVARSHTFDEEDSCISVSVDVYEILREIKEIRSELEERRKSRFSHERHSKTYPTSNLSEKTEELAEEVVSSINALRHHRSKKKDRRRISLSPVRNSLGTINNAAHFHSGTGGFSIRLDTTFHQRPHRSHRHSSSPLRRRDHTVVVELKSRDDDGTRPCGSTTIPALKHHTKAFYPVLLNLGNTFVST